MNHIYVALGMVILAVVAAYFGWRKSKDVDAYSLYVEATGVSELSSGVPSYYGGTVQALAGQPTLVTQYSKQPCVYYKYTIEQEVRRRDREGVEHVEWDTVTDAPATSVNFILQSPGGAVEVNPTNAQIDKPQTYEQFIDPSAFQPQQAGVLGKAASMLSNLGGHRVMRVREQYVPIGQQLYAGGVTNDQRIFVQDDSYPLVLSPQSKSSLVKSSRRTELLEYGGAVALVAGAIAVFTLVKQ